MKYQPLLKLYKKVINEKEWIVEAAERIDEVETITEETIVEEAEIIKQEEIIIKTKEELWIEERNKIMKSIFEFMPSIANKANGTQAEIAKMFRLYNAYYKANEKASCAQCVGNVYNKLMRLYKGN